MLYTKNIWPADKMSCAPKIFHCRSKCVQQKDLNVRQIMWRVENVIVSLVDVYKGAVTWEVDVILKISNDHKTPVILGSFLIKSESKLPVVAKLEKFLEL